MLRLQRVREGKGINLLTLQRVRERKGITLLILQRVREGNGISQISVDELAKVTMMGDVTDFSTT